MSSSRIFAFCASVSLVALGCSTSAESTHGSSADLTNDPTAPATDAGTDAAPAEKPVDVVPRPNIPRSEVVHAYSGAMRVSFDNAPYVESEWATPSIAINYSDPAPWSISGPIRIDFGHSPATTIEPGSTFSCENGDAHVMTIEDGAEGKLVARNSASCSVVIDDVSAATTDRYVRVHGYFVASSNLPDGLAHQASGTFAGDFPLPLREAPQP